MGADAASAAECEMILDQDTCVITIAKFHDAMSGSICLWQDDSAQAGMKGSGHCTLDVAFKGFQPADWHALWFAFQAVEVKAHVTRLYCTARPPDGTLVNRVFSPGWILSPLCSSVAATC